MTEKEIGVTRQLIDSIHNFGVEFGYSTWEVAHILVNDFGITGDMFKECNREGYYDYYLFRLSQIEGK
jgi:hypothetical protein